MFDRLVSVSGVGPRLALAVLSTYTVGQLYSLVMAEDDRGMAKVPVWVKRLPSASSWSSRVPLPRTRALFRST